MNLFHVDTIRVGMKWTACLNFLNTFPHRDGPHAHQWVWLYTESPLLTFLLLCVADTAPSHDAVLQGTSCTESLSQLHEHSWRVFIRLPHASLAQHLHVRDLWAALRNPGPAPDWHQCHLPKQRVSLWHPWREGLFLQTAMMWRAGSAASLFLVGQTVSW